MPHHTSHPAPGSALKLQRLLPPHPPTTVERIVDELDLTKPTAAGSPSRPYVVLNMVSTVDGRASLGGRSGGIGGSADKELFHGLRTVVDAVMAGAGTVRAERYGRLVRDERKRKLRAERGLAEEPLACVVSGRLALDEGIPLLADPQAHVAIVTSSPASLPKECRAGIDYVRAAREGTLDLPGAMSQLHNRFGVRTLLCEGGPHLNAQLLAAGLVDELFLSLSPMLAGGDAVSETLRILSGPELDPPVALELVGALEHDSHLFLRYRVTSPEQAPPR
jgi:riboflavin-specific deaminase-like protein